MPLGEHRVCPKCKTTYYRPQSWIKKNIATDSCLRCVVASQPQVIPTKAGSGQLVPCQCCGKFSYRNPSLLRKGFGKFCSRTCEASSRPNPPVERTCIVCHKVFLKDTWSLRLLDDNGRFCTRACQDRFKRKLRKRNEQEMFTQWQKREWKGDRCERCGSTRRLELDHKTPRFAGGKATRENAQTLCQTCNRKKFWTDDYPLYLHYLKLRSQKS